MLTATVRVIRDIIVTLDETKFDAAFTAEFAETIQPFDTIEQHFEHLGWLAAARGIDNFSFIEGYGPAKDMGITFIESGPDEIELLDKPSVLAVPA